MHTALTVYMYHYFNSYDEHWFDSVHVSLFPQLWCTLFLNCLAYVFTYLVKAMNCRINGHRSIGKQTSDTYCFIEKTSNIFLKKQREKNVFLKVDTIKEKYFEKTRKKEPPFLKISKPWLQISLNQESVYNTGLVFNGPGMPPGVGMAPRGRRGIWG